MRVRLTSIHRFAAAHRLHSDEHDAEWNRRVFDKCNNAHGHGHTYGLEVTVEGEIDSESGYVMDFKEMKRIVEENVLRDLDRRHLNFDVPFLAGVIPTAENIAIAIWGRLAGKFARTRLSRVVLHETEKNAVVFEG